MVSESLPCGLAHELRQNSSELAWYGRARSYHIVDRKRGERDGEQRKHKRGPKTRFSPWTPPREPKTRFSPRTHPSDLVSLARLCLLKFSELCPKTKQVLTTRASGGIWYPNCYK